MTLTQSDAKNLNYSEFFEGLRALHRDPVILESIQLLQEKTQTVLSGSASQQEVWAAKLKYMGGLRAGWDASEILVSHRSILSAEDILLELDYIMNTAFIEFEANPSGVLSLYWFDGVLKYQVVILAADREYTLIRTSALTGKKKTHYNLSKNDLLKKIMKVSTPKK